MLLLERPKWIPLDIFIEEIIFFDLTHYFIDIEAEKEKEQKSSALEDQKFENLNFRERVWVSLFVFYPNSKRPLSPRLHSRIRLRAHWEELSFRGY